MGLFPYQNGYARPIRSRPLILALALAGLASVFVVSAPGASAAPIATASDYDCADFNNQAEAEEYLLPGDPYRLDADSDGIACEDLPCPCSYSPGEEDKGTVDPPPPPPLPTLNKAVAKNAAWAKARKFDRRTRAVNGVRLNRCVRRGRYHVNCRFLAAGKVGDLTTICHLGVSVTGKGSITHARLGHLCRSYRELTAGRALAALRDEAELVAGKPTEIVEFGRHSRLTYTGLARWTRANPAAEECSDDLVAELLPSDELIVRSRGLECLPA